MKKFISKLSFTGLAIAALCIGTMAGCGGGEEVKAPSQSFIDSLPQEADPDLKEPSLGAPGAPANVGQPPKR